MAEPRVVWTPVSQSTVRHVLEQMTGQSRDGRYLAPQGGTVHFASQRRTLGQTSLAVTTMSALRMHGDAGRDPATTYLTFVLSGVLTVTPPGGERVPLPPGSACAVADWRGFEIESGNGTRHLQIEIPTERLTERGVRVSASRFRLEGRRSLRAPLRGFALAIADSSWRGSTVGEAVAERTLEDLVVGMFLESAGYTLDSEDLRAGLRGRALSEIAASHRSPELSPAIVAQHLAVSLRHLQRAFESSGSSVASSITRRRAETASLLLTAPGATCLTIDEVARRAGFSSVFELRAAFRRIYGVLPSEFREARSISVPGKG